MTTITSEADITAKIARRIAELEAQRKATPEQSRLPISTTRADADSIAERRRRIEQQLAAIRAAADRLAAIDDGEVDRKWLAFLTSTRDALVAELFLIKSPIRDRALKAVAADLDFSIRLIDYGMARVCPLGATTLVPTSIGRRMAVAGYQVEGEGLHDGRGWRGSIPETEQRLAQLTKQRTAARYALDMVLRTDEESAAVAATFAGVHIKRNATGDGYVITDEFGEPKSDVTAAERAAVARLEAADQEGR